MTGKQLCRRISNLALPAPRLWPSLLLLRGKYSERREQRQIVKTVFSQFDHTESQPISLNYGMQAQRYIL